MTSETVNLGKQCVKFILKNTGLSLLSAEAIVIATKGNPVGVAAGIAVGKTVKNVGMAVDAYKIGKQYIQNMNEIAHV